MCVCVCVCVCLCVCKNVLLDAQICCHLHIQIPQKPGFNVKK